VKHAPIYCDHNAGAPVRPEAGEALARALALGGNPSSVHGAGRAAKAVMEDARERVAGAVGASAENVVFTSGATEALHLALAAVQASGAAQRLIISAIEHDAMNEQASLVWPDVDVAPVGADGLVDIAALKKLLASDARPALVAVMLANNETGAIQPIGKVAACVREAGGLLLVDGAQAIGRMGVDIADLDASYLVLSSHKAGGPQGAGALVLAPGAPFATTRRGGGQERGRRPGTENVPAIAGFAAAVECAVRDLDSEAVRLAALRDRFERGLPGDAVIFAKDAPRLPNTSLFALPGMSAETAVIALDLDGLCVSSGAACSSGKVRPSRVLSAMGVAVDVSKRALRVSFGWSSREADVDAALAAIGKVFVRRRALEGAV
jgi:cysteine desulfurase